MRETDKNPSLDDVWYVYDGECPVCQMGASLYEVRKSIGKLHTIDARTEIDHPVMIEINLAGLDLDQGSVIKYQNQLYHGKAVLEIMSKLGSKKGWFNKINNTLFQSRILAVFCYPFMRMTRNFLLKLKGVSKLRNLETPNE